MYGLLPPITKTIQFRRKRHVGHCWRSRDELISDILPWTPSHGRAKAGRPTRTYIQQFYADTGCSLEDLLGAMDDWDRWRERLREIRAGSATSWWWMAYQPSWVIKYQSHPCRRIVIIFTNPYARAGYDTRSIFKRSLTGLNSKFSFS